MGQLQELIRRAEQDGYHDEYAESKVCQDIVLTAVSSAGLEKHTTVKGGVVMRSISGNARRATQLPVTCKCRVDN